MAQHLAKSDDKNGGLQLETGTKAPTPQTLLQKEPDSRCRRWLQVLGVFIVWTNSWGLSNSFGVRRQNDPGSGKTLIYVCVQVFQTFYENDLLSSKTSSQISWIGSLQPFLLLFAGVLSGPLYDAGHFRMLLIVGNFLVVFGLMMTR